MKLRFDHRVIAAALLAIALVASGCSKSTSITSLETPLDQASADDLAMQTAQALNAAVLDVEGASSSLVTTSAMRPLIAPFAALWDTTITGEGYTLQASREFYNAAGTLLPNYGPTAARMVWRSRITGSHETGSDTVVIAHGAQLNFAGIQPGDTAFTVSGAAVDTLQCVYRSYDGTRWRYCHCKSVLAIANAVISRTREWPLSGTLTFTMNADRLRSNNAGDVEAHLAGTIVITFNGTSQPDVVVNGTWRYHWDMEYRTMIRA